MGEVGLPYRVYKVPKRPGRANSSGPRFWKPDGKCFRCASPGQSALRRLCKFLLNIFAGNCPDAAELCAIVCDDPLPFSGLEALHRKTPMPHEVFISYSSIDKEIADTVCA